MHFSSNFIMAVAPLLLTQVTAAPAAEMQSRAEDHIAPRSVLGDLNAGGQIEWSDDDEGSFAQVSTETIDKWHKTHSSKRGWQDFPNIVGQYVSGACEEAGKGIDASLLEEWGGHMCDKLIKLSAAGQAVDGAYKGWNVYREVKENSDNGESKGLAAFSVGWRRVQEHYNGIPQKTVCDGIVEAVADVCEDGGGDTKGANSVFRDAVEWIVAVDDA